MRLFVDNLCNVDFSYLCPQRGLVGETWLANIELTGDLNQEGMVCDFGIVKKQLRTWLDEEIDHRLLVPAESAEVTAREGQLEVKLQEITCQSPAQAITLIDDKQITPISVAEWAINKLHGKFGEGVENINLSFVTEDIPGPFYHYSHGLKKHSGNCQRIAHGHRSKIEVWRNGQLDRDAMNQWAKLFSDIYIGTREDIKEERSKSITFAYTSAQGCFELSLPKNACYLIDSDSTVELIAHHIWQVLKQREPEVQFRVKAYEGIGKGAVVEG